MEKRILLAFALSFMVFYFYVKMFAPPPPVVEPLELPAPEAGEPGERPGEVAEKRTAEEPEAPRGAGGEERPERGEDEPVVGERIEAGLETQILVDTDLYHAVFSNRGGKLTSLVLKGYEDSEGRQYEMVPGEGSDRLGIHPLDIELEDLEDTERIKEALFEPSAERLDLREGDEGELSFLWADGRGLEVEKTIRVRGASYVLGVDVSARRGGRELRKKILYGPGVGDEAISGTYRQPDKGVIMAGEQLALFDAGDVADGEGAAVDVTAVGVASHYFVALMLPSAGRGYGASFFTRPLTVEGVDGKEGERVFITAVLDVPVDEARMRLFVGPKEHDRLARLGPGVEDVIEYGPWMRYMALPLRSALLWIHGYVGNYGWAIVFLTVLINVALIPLKHHSYVSMKKMQKLAPQIKRIQEKYKKLKPTDPRQQEKNKEIYALYKEEKVSPMSGCLPMLLMIPFFFAFYRLLMVSIELRHAPFGLWIQDLATYDPYFILPIMMGVTQIAIQKMSPQTSADPVQAKIMMLMPVMFVFILAWAPAGLVLYWFVNNLVSIAQQTVTNRLITPDGKSANEGGGRKSQRNRREKKQMAGRS